MYVSISVLAHLNSDKDNKNPRGLTLKCDIFQTSYYERSQITSVQQYRQKEQSSKSDFHCVQMKRFLAALGEYGLVHTCDVSEASEVSIHG